MLKELEQYGLQIKDNTEQDNPEPIDKLVVDEDDNVVARFWGSDIKDTEWDCDHPYQCIDFGGDIDEQGVCLLCGTFCDWHYEPNGDDREYPEVHEWCPRRDVGGWIAEYIKQTQKATNA